VNKIAAAFCPLCLLIAGCAADSSKAQWSRPHGDSSLESREEIAVGEKIHARIASSFYVYTEPHVNAYLQKIGGSLARFAERQDIPYRFTLLYNANIYAASAPGGFIYLTTGLVQFLDNEAELAAVLGHEIGQLQYRDPRLLKSRKILEAITKTGQAVAPAFGQIGVLAALGLAMLDAAVDAQAAAPAEKLLGADRRAFSYMVRAGYDPQGLLDVLHKFSAAGRQAAAYFYDYDQSRPVTEERMLALRREFSLLPLQGKRFSVHRRTYQQMTKGIRQIYSA